MTWSQSKKKVSVLLKGLDEEQQEEGQLLGQFVYEEDGDALQTFLVSVSIVILLFQSFNQPVAS